jgi:hypothetical protein
MAKIYEEYFVISCCNGVTNVEKFDENGMRKYLDSCTEEDLLDFSDTEEHFKDHSDYEVIVRGNILVPTKDWVL